MELDFAVIKALSSPSRVRLLNFLVEREMTTSELSQEFDRSKSTISAHLDKLHEAGLVEKDKEEGRRRVTYSASREGRIIANQKERKMKFSLVSSVVLAAAGGAITVLSPVRGSSPAPQNGSGTGVGIMSTEKPPSAAPETSQGLLSDPNLLIGAVLIASAAVAAGYLFYLSQVPEKEEELLGAEDVEVV
ncbi:MAG: metalloregulator ArsR/SmtB family transcription factor [Candidatus Nanohaloarchaea archaeon]